MSKPLIFFVFLSGFIFSQGFIHQSPIFPFQDKHVHASSLVEILDGDLIACWFYGSGERTANDVLIQGSRLRKGSDNWGPVFTMADTPDLPDCNPVLFINQKNELMLFWVAVVANQWENSILRYKISTRYNRKGAPEWDWQDIIILKPGDSFFDLIKKAFRRSLYGSCLGSVCLAI